ncbi:low temperature requirement protein A [Conexibacter sp. W3-3-2]|uniref:low temperature requirement protein A n=1 Tax=Conexibacter sp. W3-3-2 TaxID=2675227 RepID=UPI0012B7652A|nr:low temperature requirement protein A [Conexibacter sp. W3-3-2]MTD46809.1 low temperature requirement protein A [Conexibacter sp. W3-3-2]
MSTAARPRGRQRLTGRDPGETHRTATPLELLYDLTFVVAFGVAADEFAHYVADDHVRTALLSFVFAVFAVSWAWINYSWFASAYDTDDWICRLAVMVQMAGVVVVALGIESVFDSIDEGDTLDNTVLVLGYVVMRVALLFLWLQAARHDPARRPTIMVYVRTLALAQVGWVALIVLELPLATAFAASAVLIAVEVSGPTLAERRGGTPWHAHHIAERYGLLVIITLGEGIIGTVAAMNAVVHGEDGWTTTAAVVVFAGIGMTFAAWWAYFSVPWAQALERHRDRSFGWGYGHIAVFGGLAAMGGGLHVVAYLLEGKAKIGEVGVVLSVALPLALFLLALYAMVTAIFRSHDPLHLLLVALTVVVLLAGVGLAAAGVSVAVCLVVLMLAPIVTVVGYEVAGHRHLATQLAD